MKNKATFYLTSLSVKILAVLITIALVSLTIIFIVYKDQVSLYIILISVLLSCILMFFMIMFFLHRIVIDVNKQIIKIQNIKVQKLDLQSISSVYVDTEFSLNKKKYCFIVFKSKDLKRYKSSGYSSLFNKNSVQKSAAIVEQIKNILNLKTIY